MVGADRTPPEPEAEAWGREIGGAFAGHPIRPPHRRPEPLRRLHLRGVAVGPRSLPRNPGRRGGGDRGGERSGRAARLRPPPGVGAVRRRHPSVLADHHRRLHHPDGLRSAPGPGRELAGCRGAHRSRTRGQGDPQPSPRRDALACRDRHRLRDRLRHPRGPRSVPGDAGATRHRRHPGTPRGRLSVCLRHPGHPGRGSA